MTSSGRAVFRANNEATTKLGQFIFRKMYLYAYLALYTHHVQSNLIQIINNQCFSTSVEQL